MTEPTIRELHGAAIAARAQYEEACAVLVGAVARDLEERYGFEVKRATARDLQGDRRTLFRIEVAS